MVLPVTGSAALTLIILSIIFLSLWPNLFKFAGRWRFELFSFDFAIGALVLALIAAYTLGTLGAELNFSDSMLVAGRRAELMAIAAGGVFALGNMLYFATIALLGMTNGTLVTFSAFGCALCLLQLMHGHLVTASSGVLILAVAAALAVVSANSKRIALRPPATKKPGQVREPLSGSTKGAITGILAGLIFGAVWPVLQMAQTDELGIGPYGGLLMATIGILASTFFFNFFFLNVSLEGGTIGYSNYLAGTMKNHLTGVLCGVLWAAGALALYAACTGTASVRQLHPWIAPFAAALIAVISGLAFWQKSPQPADARRNTLISTALLIGGIAVLLAGMP